MQLRTRRRLVASIALPLFSTVVVLGCRDRQLSDPDVFADRTLVSLQVRSELTSFSTGKATQLAAVSQQASLVVFPDHSSRASLNVQPGRRVVVRHFRDQRGTIHSIGTVNEGGGRPPKLVYAFENGHIRAIVGSEYQRYGKGWIRRQSRVTYFDSTGKPTLQVVTRPDLQSEARESTRGIKQVAADVLAVAKRVVLPAELHAEEGTCWSEWAIYGAASFALAAASSLVTGAATACLDGVIPACAAVQELVAKWTVALIAWNAALDKLVECREKDAGQSVAGEGDSGAYGDGAGGSSGTGSGGGEGSGDATVGQSVMSFITDAIIAGNFYCDGNTCVYYAA